MRLSRSDAREDFAKQADKARCERITRLDTQGSNELAEALIAYMAQLPTCAVAFSGGVDSAVVAKAAHLTLGERALAITAVSFSLSSYERQIAIQVANEIGIRHCLVETAEIENAAYRANRGDRCYHCKSTLYQCMLAVIERANKRVIVNGTNADDLSDYRPGLKAAAEYDVRSPLAELGLGKVQVRQLARHWSLTVADKPASPCLASRIAYGVEVNQIRLRRVEAAEALVRNAEFDLVRVRCLAGDIASVEVATDKVERLRERFRRESLQQKLLDLGFQSVRIESAGYRSGRLNDGLLTLVASKQT